MYARMLVPFDGSDSAAAAVDRAVELAATFGSAVHVLYVVDAWAYDTSIESAVEPLREEGEAHLKRLADRIGPVDVPITTAIEVGRPARHILEYATEHDIELIVMGTRGRGGLQLRLLGSVTQYVVTHAEIPVHVVPAVDGLTN